ncbi:MAG TPA: hypothetical protein VG964_00470 [Candidatus Saccharimonadales bacterium]|nr:hypothetical protein [Candidatus Saccharimonadales bacterium]
MQPRYIPFVQQPYCCVPACIQTVLYKNNIPLKSQEEIGNALGLRVKLERAHLFENVSTEEPATGVWGTQVGNPDYDINEKFDDLGIPMKVEIKHIKEIGSPDELREMLQEIENEDGDALVCFRYGSLWDDGSSSGHVNVFDQIVDGKIRLVDPAIEVPKFRMVEVDKLYKAMVEHEAAVSPGLWLFSPKITN